MRIGNGLKTQQAHCGACLERLLPKTVKHKMRIRSGLKTQQTHNGVRLERFPTALSVRDYFFLK